VKITGVGTASVGANYENGLGKSFFALGLSQGGIYHDR
jgi:hypothetical protein